ncbi:MAG: cytochrome c3 family protein [Nitrospirae bacterium]|nr:cytochrome c3 family protein [Nitrospirota bacterium]
MKKTILIIMLSVVLMTGSAFAGTVANSKHNLLTGWTTGAIVSPHVAAAGSVTVCGFCHIPHGSTPNSAAPLWARDLTTIGGAFYYNTYGSGSGNQTLAATPVGDPGANSLTCLSCHDGSIGLGVTYKNGISNTQVMTSTPANLLVAVSGTMGALNYAGYTASYGAGSSDPGYNPAIGGPSTTDLTNDHPVGVQYMLDGRAGLNAVLPNGAGQFKFYGAGSNVVECATCHNPHDNDLSKFLRVAKATICTDCHSNK